MSYYACLSSNYIQISMAYCKVEWITVCSIFWLVNSLSETYSGPFQTSMIVSFFAKKKTITDVWHGFKYASGPYLKLLFLVL